MISLERYFKVLFTDAYISREQLRKFMEDHLKRLAVNNTDNKYDELINETQQLYELYFGSLTDADTSAALQQSRTKSMEGVRDQFTHTVQRREGLITNSFPKDSPEYQEFFPHGLSEYTEATLENVETLMVRLITASAAHSADLGTKLTDEFSKLKEAFLTARGKQLEQKGTASKASEKAGEQRDAVEIQLTKNVLTIALKNIGKTAMAAVYFDESIIARASSSGNSGSDGDTDLGNPQPEPVK